MRHIVKTVAGIMAILSLGMAAMALDDDGKWTNTGTTDEIGLECRGFNSSGVAYSDPSSLKMNCTTGTLSVVTPKIGNTVASGKLACIKSTGELGNCEKADTYTTGFCDLCY